MMNVHTVESRLSAVFDALENKKNDTAEYYNQFLASIKKTGTLVLFGAGVYGCCTREMFQSQGIAVNYFCDNKPDLWQHTVEGIPCISPEELEIKKDTVTVVISTMHFHPIREQLFTMGCRAVYQINCLLFPQRERITNSYLLSHKSDIESSLALFKDDESRLVFVKRLEALVAMSTGFDWGEIARPLDEQYKRDTFTLTEHENFIDGGAYDGDTLYRFLADVQFKFDSAHVFELNPDNFEQMLVNIQKLPADVQKKITAVNKGLFSHADSFEITREGESSTILQDRDTVSSTSADCAEVDAIDNMISTPVSFIKLDIEGAELAALRGAKNTIQKNAPALAVCMYHKIEDLWEIPLYIHAIMPNYQFFLRHYTHVDTETVLQCSIVPEERKV